MYLTEDGCGLQPKHVGAIKSIVPLVGARLVCWGHWVRLVLIIKLKSEHRVMPWMFVQSWELLCMTSCKSTAGLYLLSFVHIDEHNYSDLCNMARHISIFQQNCEGSIQKLVTQSTFLSHFSTTLA